MAKKKFTVIENIQTNHYDSLEKFDMDDLKDELKLTAPNKVNFVIEEVTNNDPRNNHELIRTSSLENIKLKARGRSKSAFFPNSNKTFSNETVKLFILSY